MNEIINKVDYPEYHFKSEVSSYEMEISIVNGDIVFITISGVAVYEEYLKAQVYLNKFIKEKIKQNNTYYLFHNYANLVEIPAKTRISYKNWVLNHVNLFDYVFFFNLNLISQLIIKLGKTTTPLFDKIFIVKDFNDALEFIKKKKSISYFSNNKTKLSKEVTRIIESKSIVEKDEWSGIVDNGRFIHSSFVIDGNIIIRKLEGVFYKGDMKYLIDTLDVIKKDMGLENKKYFLFLDAHKLFGIKIHSRTEAVEWFVKEAPNFHLSGFFGADKLSDLVIKFSINVSSLKNIVFSYSSLNEVLEIVFTYKGYISINKPNIKSSFIKNIFNQSQRIKELEAENARLIEFNSDRIDKLFKIIGEITWNEELAPPNIEIDDSDPYSDVFYSLKLLYFDVKEIIEKRDELIEKAKEADMLKSAFLANLSHEIRTPLNGIIGFTDLLLEEEGVKGNQKQFLEIIKKNSDNLLKLINDIIQISTIEAKQVKIKRKSFNLTNMLIQLENMFKSIVIKDEINIDVKYVKINNETLFIESDELRLNQILVNIIGNAVKFTKEGNVFFGYNIISVKGEKYIKFYIKDTGIGIEKEQQNIIFDRFRQIDDGNTRNYGGAGLGLSISKNLVEILGGEIWIESEIGVGSTFFITIPYVT